MSSVLQSALSYASLGWRVHPLRAPGEQYKSKGVLKVSDGKSARIYGWPAEATIDEEKIAEWWEQWNDANVGVVLGPSSKIVDIECDSPEAEALLQELFASHEIVTPTFRSAKGLHRIFRFSTNLPNSDKAHWTLMPKGVQKGGIDFKIGNDGKGTYCVFPPSVHKTGHVYHWLPGLSPQECEIAEIPLHVIARIEVYLTEGSLTSPTGKGRPKEIWDQVEKGVPDGGGPLGGRNNAAASLAGKYLREIDINDAKALAVVHEKLQQWNLKNVPAEESSVITTTFENVLGLERRSREVKASVDPLRAKATDILRGAKCDSKEDMDSRWKGFAEWNRSQEIVLTEKELKGAWNASLKDEKAKQAKDAHEQRSEANGAEDYRLVRVNSKPLKWKLFHPRWSDFVLLTTTQLETPRLLRQEVAEQKTGVSFDCYFAADWLGNKNNPKGILGSLYERAESEEADPGDCEDRFHADLIYGCFVSATEDDDPAKSASQQGRPIKRASGDIWFIPKYILLQAGSLKDFPTRNQVNRILTACGATWDTHLVNGRKMRFQVLTQEGLKALESMSLKGIRSNENSGTP